MTSDIMIPDASALTVDTSCIDVSEVSENQSELIEAGASFIKTTKLADYAIETVTRQIRTQEWREKGRIIRDIQSLLKNQQAMKYWYSIGLWDSSHHPKLGLEKLEGMTAYADAMKLALDDSFLTGANLPEEFALQIPRSTVKALRQGMPLEVGEFFLKEAAESGHVPSLKEVKEITDEPEMKLSKTAELLQKMQVKKEKAIEDGDAQGKFEAQKSINNYTQKIADLEAQIEEEKLRTAEETEEKARVEKELQKLKFDDASARAERVKRVSSTLTLSIPQTLADVQKFFAEVDQYPQEVRKHILEQSTLLANYIGDHL